jgi:hypothetical protein
MAIKRTFGFDEYQKKISEGIEDIGFKRYIEEHEEENTTSVDDLGQGEAIDTAPKGEEAPATEEPTAPEKDEADTLSTPIDTGNREDVTLDEVKVKMNFISQYVKNLSSLTASAETVPLDKATKEKVVKLYNIIQGIA